MKKSILALALLSPMCIASVHGDWEVTTTYDQFSNAPTSTLHQSTGDDTMVELLCNGSFNGYRVLENSPGVYQRVGISSAIMAGDLNVVFFAEAGNESIKPMDHWSGVKPSIIADGEKALTLIQYLKDGETGAHSLTYEIRTIQYTTPLNFNVFVISSYGFRDAYAEFSGVCYE